MDPVTITIIGSIVAAFAAGGALWGWMGGRQLQRENRELRAALSRKDGTIDALLERD